MPKHVMIIAGEASGDMHGGDLARELLNLDADLKLSGMGGAAMAAAGVKLYRDIKGLAVMGIFEVARQLVDIRSAMTTLEKQFAADRPDLLILIDYPGFNLELARRAKKFKIPVFYYISPKVWAWREGRLKKIKKYVDRLAVILPFEKDYYRQQDIEVDYVGNPLVDQVQVSLGKDELKARYEIDREATIIGIMPGSRKQEVSRLLPLFLQAAHKLEQKIGRSVFILPLASTLTEEDLAASAGVADRLDIRLIRENRYEAMALCDAAMAASGTLTLELALLRVPMVVCYRVQPLTYMLAKPFIRVAFASLVNLIAGREIVPELLQHAVTPDNICRQMQDLLLNRKRNREMRRELARVCRQLGEPGASGRAAEIALEMIKGVVL